MDHGYQMLFFPTGCFGHFGQIPASWAAQEELARPELAVLD
jgi:hypothetical protein